MSTEKQTTALPPSLSADSGFVLVDFYATWCEPCKHVPPILQEVQNHFDHKLSIHFVDIDSHETLTRELHIMSVPTLILFHDGHEVWRMRGFDIATNLIRQIEPLLTSE